MLDSKHPCRRAPAKLQSFLTTDPHGALIRDTEGPRVHVIKSTTRALLSPAATSAFPGHAELQPPKAAWHHSQHLLHKCPQGKDGFMNTLLLVCKASSARSATWASLSQSRGAFPARAGLQVHKGTILNHARCVRRSGLGVTENVRFTKANRLYQLPPGKKDHSNNMLAT